MSVPFDLRNISEKKIPFFEEGRRKKGLGWGGGALCRYFLRGKSKLPHPWGFGGGGGVEGVGGHLMEWP